VLRTQAAMEFTVTISRKVKRQITVESGVKLAPYLRQKFSDFNEGLHKVNPTLGHMDFVYDGMDLLSDNVLAKDLNPSRTLELIFTAPVDSGSEMYGHLVGEGFNPGKFKSWVWLHDK
jgi:hypothetical protein